MKFSLVTLGLLLCMAVPANADLLYSWEGGGLDGWFSPEATASLSVGTTGATDGTNAAKIEHTHVGPPNEVALLRIDNGDSTWFTALKNADNTNMLVDVFVPASSLNTASWAKVGFRLQGPFGQVDTAIDFAKVGGVYLDQWVTMDLDITGVAADLPTANWGQVTVTINGAPTNTKSPVYVDNYRLVTAVPEPSSAVFITIGSALLGLVRRRRS